MTYRRILMAAVSAVTLAGAAVGVQAEDMGNVNVPIKLAMNEWTGQHISTAVAGEALKRMGYDVEYLTVGYFPQITAVADGEIDATLEVWTSNIGEGWDAQFDSGAVEIIGQSGLQPEEGWWVPSYVVDMCPGLPNWEALNDCAELFGTADTMPAGRFLDYPADWGDKNRPRIEGLGLNFVNIPAGSEGAIIAEIKSAYERQAPLLTMFWAPHWVHAEYDLQEIILPPYEEGCLEDPALGLNPDVTWDCGWNNGEIFRAVNPALKESHPAAWKLIEVYEINNLEQAQMMLEIDNKGRDLIDVVNEWLDTHPEKVQVWIDTATM